MKKIILSALLAGIAFSVNAQDISIDDMGKPDPSRMSAGIYALDTHHSHIAYDVNHFGVSRYLGLVGGLSGKLKIDPDRPSEAQVEIDIPLSGIVSTSTALDAHLKTADFFDIEKFPVAKFRSTSIKVKGTEAVITGHLTLRDITKPVELRTNLVGIAVNPMSTLLNVGFEATTRIKRSEFGVSYLAPFISDEVDLRISAVFEDTQ